MSRPSKAQRGRQPTMPIRSPLPSPPLTNKPIQNDIILPGEDLSNFLIRKRRGYHNEKVLYGPPSLFVNLPLPKDDGLFQSLSLCVSDERCAVCRLHQMHHAHVELENGKAIAQTSSMPVFIMHGCGHVLHEACLYTYLSEPKSIVTCARCQALKFWVSAQDWSAQDLDEALERIKFKSSGGQEVERMAINARLGQWKEEEKTSRRNGKKVAQAEKDRRARQSARDLKSAWRKT